MKPLLPALVLSLGLSTAAALPVAAYPVDCAIFLCLAGGWPASAECAHARAVFIQRITPWPIEPPLQIWNCPMRARLSKDATPIERLIDIAYPVEPMPPLASMPGASAEILRVQDQADIDISDPAFDFVRSIHVFEITYSQRWSERGDCKTSSSVHVGSYGLQGDYQRRPSNLAAVPAAAELKIPDGCRTYSYRSVFVDWRDYEGTYGHEEVRY